MRARALLVVASLFALVPVTGAYHQLQHVTPGGRTVGLAWSEGMFPVGYFVNNRPPLDFSVDAAVQATQQSFQTWEDVETSEITFNYEGLTSAEPFTFFDGQSTLGFTDDPDLARLNFGYRLAYRLAGAFKIVQRAHRIVYYQL